MMLDTQFFFLLNSLAGQSAKLDGAIIFFAQNLPTILFVLLFMAGIMSVVLFMMMIVFPQMSDKTQDLYDKFFMALIPIASAIIARYGVKSFIQLLYYRPRPFMAHNVTQLIHNDSWNSSFPSGHAAFFFAFAVALYFYDRKWGIGFLCAAALISVSRVVAGVHYPSDILGGVAVGVATAFGVRYTLTKCKTLLY